MSSTMKAEVISAENKDKKDKDVKQVNKHSGRPPYPDGTVVISGSYGTEIHYPDGEVFKYSWRPRSAKNK